MEDAELVALFFARDESAVRETAAVYGSYCRSIALRFLENNEDAEECCNDTWLRAWNSIPPQKPLSLRAFLAKITRNLAFDRLRRNSAEKRSGVCVLLDELSECLADTQNIESQYDAAVLAKSVSVFLRTLPQRDREIFLRRYFFGDPAKEIASQCNMTESCLRMNLSRTRKKLRAHLIAEGYLTERQGSI